MNKGWANLEKAVALQQEMYRQRTEKLLELIPVGQLIRASDLSSAVQCSERTVYRHVQSLRAKGHKIKGEHGIGYWRRS